MHPNLSEIPEEMLPLYRLYHEGADHLSEPELMSIVIGTGVSEERALYMSNDIFSKFNLSNLGGASVAQLCKIPCITKMKASVISAAFELSRRHAMADMGDPVRISSPEAAFKYLYPMLRDEKVEHFVSLLLDTKNRLIKKIMVSKGSLNANIVHPREVFQPAILEGAAAINCEYKDVSTAIFDLAECECTNDGPDGFLRCRTRVRRCRIVEGSRVAFPPDEPRRHRCSFCHAYRPDWRT